MATLDFRFYGFNSSTNRFACSLVFKLGDYPLAHGIDWARAIGIGYAIQSLPVGQAKLEAFRPLYVMLIPNGPGTQVTLIPVGQLGDLDSWLTQQRQGSITQLALVLLVIGFFLQLVSSF